MLEPNTILDIELGKIPPNVAVTMLLEERRESRLDAAEVIEELESQIILLSKPLT